MRAISKRRREGVPRAARPRGTRVSSTHCSSSSRVITTRASRPAEAGVHPVGAPRAARRGQAACQTAAGDRGRRPLRGSDRRWRPRHPLRLLWRCRREHATDDDHTCSRRRRSGNARPASSKATVTIAWGGDTVLGSSYAMPPAAGPHDARARRAALPRGRHRLGQPRRGARERRLVQVRRLDARHVLRVRRAA